MEKTYKFCGEKLDEKSLREKIDFSLDSAITTCDIVLNSLNQITNYKDFIEKNQNKPYKLSFFSNMMDMMNGAWDKQMEIETKNNQRAIEENNLEFIAKDVESTIIALPKLSKTLEKLLNNALQNELMGDMRYACELYKYVERTMQESKDYYTLQKEYNQKYLDNDMERE